MTTYTYIHDEPCPMSGVEHTHDVTAIGERLPWRDPFLMADCARDTGAPWWCVTHDRGVEKCRAEKERLTAETLARQTAPALMPTKTPGLTLDDASYHMAELVHEGTGYDMECWNLIAEALDRDVPDVDPADAEAAP
jgi:hypothetical protein